MFNIFKKNKKIKEPIFTEKQTYKDTKLNYDNLKNILGESKDIKFKRLYINANKNLDIGLVYLDGMVDNKIINDDVIKPLIQEVRLSKAKNTKEIIDLVEHGTIYTTGQKTLQVINDVISEVLTGSTAIIFDKENIAVTFETKGFEKRSITKPKEENVIKGAKDAFTETLRDNTTIVRRKIKSANLIIDETKVGKQTMTPVAVIYMKNIANDYIVKEVKKRLNSIDIDQVTSVGFIEEYITDYTFFIFPQVYYTERSDKFCANIVEGRVGIIIDGFPITYIVPATFNQLLQAPEDYSQNYFVSSTVRLMRYISMLGTLLLPAFYISVTTFHHEMIPTELGLSISAAKQGVPFPSFIEVIIMLVAFEILLEAGLRLPKTIGNAVTIVGALVVGEAAVNAKLVSPAVVIVLAITVISNFTMPNQDFSNALRVWRFAIVILSSMLGLIGLSIGLIILIYNLSRIECFGIPYLSPFVSSDGKDVKNDTVFRLPLKFNEKRPFNLKVSNKKRQNQGKTE